jgi:AraC-like DNA-binding protein
MASVIREFDLGHPAERRRRQLERCRQDLLDPGLQGRPAGAIGARWGFRDAAAAAFSRVFRDAYGLPPAEYRATHAGSQLPLHLMTRLGQAFKRDTSPSPETAGFTKSNSPHGEHSYQIQALGRIFGRDGSRYHCQPRMDRVSLVGAGGVDARHYAVGVAA